MLRLPQGTRVAQADCRGSAKDLKACATGLAGRRVMVDLDDPVDAVVYLEAFTS